MRLRRAMCLALVPLAIAASGSGRAVAADRSSASPASSGTSGVASPGGGATVTFGLQPASARQPDDRPYFDYGVTPGSQVSDHVAITNYSPSPLSLQLYSTDSINTADGGFALLGAMQTATDAGAWTSLRAPQTVLVPARSITAEGNQRPGQVIVGFTVTVPDDASPGDHVAGVVASLNSADDTAAGPTVQLEQRLATRLYLRVSGPLRPQLQISAVRTVYHGSPDPARGGTVTVTFALRNSGNVALTGSESVTVHGLLVKRAANLPDGQLPVLLPGARASMSATVAGVLPAGPLLADVRIARITSPGHSGIVLADVGAHRRLMAVPWIVVAALGLALAVVAGALSVRRAQRTKGPGPGRHHRRSAPSRPRHGRPIVQPR